MGRTAGILLFLAVTGTGFAQSWTSNSLPFLYVLGAGMSADGSVIASASGDHGVYVSTDYGATWTNYPQTVTGYGGRAGVSADGKKIFVLGGSSKFACSTNSGKDWFFAGTNAPLMFNFLAVSADGNTLIGGSDSGLFTSTNGGVNWVTNFNGAWKCGAASGDGLTLLAGCGAGYTNGLVISTNSGATWRSSQLPLKGWSSAICSVDGQTMVALAYTPAAIYISTNGGLNWITNAPPSPYNSPYLSGSADAQKLVYWLNPSVGYLYTSTNLGATWITNAVPLDYWTQALVTADGNRRVAFKNQSMWVSTDDSPPALNLQRSGDGLVASWTVPSMAFHLDAALGSVSAGWSQVTNSPTLNNSNLHYEVDLPISPGSAFFRLSGMK